MFSDSGQLKDCGINCILSGLELAFKEIKVEWMRDHYPVKKFYDFKVVKNQED